MAHAVAARPTGATLYTPEQFERRQQSVWTLVQGILAPLQFLVFLVSLVLVLGYVITGDGYGVATVSIVIKTGFLYTIMVTGAIWEKVVFGQYLFAPAFFWEDVFSFVVIALHSAYIAMLWQVSRPTVSASLCDGLSTVLRCAELHEVAADRT